MIRCADSTGHEGLTDLDDQVRQDDEQVDPGNHKQDRQRPMRHAAVQALFYQHRAGQGSQAVEDHEHQAGQQRHAELVQQPAQAETPVLDSLFFDVDDRDITHRGKGVDACQ